MEQPEQENKSRSAAGKWVLAIIAVIAAVSLVVYFWPSGEDEGSTGASQQNTPSVFNQQTQESTDASTPTSEVTSTSAPSSASPSATSNQLSPVQGDQEGQAPGLSEWQPVAESFAKNWANPSGGKEEWLKRLRPVTTDDAYDGLKYTDERNIQKLELDEVEMRSEDEGLQKVLADASYKGEGALLRMGLEPDNSGEWKVSYITEAS